MNEKDVQKFKILDMTIVLIEKSSDFLEIRNIEDKRCNVINVLIAVI